MQGEESFKSKILGIVKTEQNVSEDPGEATMNGLEVLKTGCRREKAGQSGYWRGTTGHCVTC